MYNYSIHILGILIVNFTFRIHIYPTYIDILSKNQCKEVCYINFLWFLHGKHEYIKHYEVNFQKRPMHEIMFGLQSVYYNAAWFV
jgi:hypothetical protein